MYYPTVKDIEIIIKQFNERYKADVVIINRGQLEFALDKPNANFYGKEQYQELYQKAAILMETITKLHSLSDGNKRTAMLAAEFMIKVNGGELVLPLKTIRLSVDTAMDEQDLMYAEIQKWFKVHAAMNIDQLSLMLQEHIEEETIIKTLWNEGKYDEVEKLASKWLAFDSYPEHKKAWDQLVEQWKTNAETITEKKIEQKNESSSAIWQSVLDLAKYQTREISDNIIIDVKNEKDLLYNNHDIDELCIIDESLKKREKFLVDNDVNSLHTAAIVLHTFERFEEAIDYHKKIIKIEGESSHQLSHIGTILAFDLEKYDEALTYLDKCLKLKPNEIAYLGNKSMTLQELGRYEDAISYLNKILEQNENDAKTLRLKGLSLAMLKKYEAALACLDKSYSIDDDINTLGLKGTILNEIRKEEKAIECFDKILEKNPNHVLALYNKALAFDNVEKNDEAIKLYQKILEIKPDHLESLINLGSTLSNQDRRAEALPYLKKALSIDPTHEIALTSMVITLEYLEKFDELPSYIDQLLKIDPNNVPAFYAKAIILSKRGEVLKALDALEKCIKLAPEIKSDLKYDVNRFFENIKDSERFKKIVLRS